MPPVGLHPRGAPWATVGTVTLLLATSLAGCVGTGAARLIIGDLDHRLAADPAGGMVMRFNVTVHNVGAAEARNTILRIDGMNRTPPETMHYGVSERTVRLIPPGETFVVQGTLDVYNDCHPHSPNYAECLHRDTYFTISDHPANGPRVVKTFLAGKY